MRTPRNKSHMAYTFGAVPTVSMPRSKFRLDRTLKTDFNAGLLIPFFVEEVLPGDTVSVNSNIIARLATPLVPIMDNIYIDTHFFYVPNRLLWENWEKFCGAQENPGDSTDFLIPEVDYSASPVVENTLHSYLTMPVGFNRTANAWWCRAYYFIWNEWFRDQNLQDSLTWSKGNGPDLAADFVLQRRAKRHDYFTSCLPFPQKGPEVELPLGSLAPVIGNDSPLITSGLKSWNTVPPTGETYLNETAGGDVYVTSVGTGSTGLNVTSDPDETTLFADLSTATASTISSLRFAFQYQKKLERDARSGTRHNEHLLAHWRVVVPDFRLQRPEYLGGSSQRVGFETVANTNISDTSSADLSAFGVSVGSGHGFVKSFVEHGVLLGMLSARADITYQQGLDRKFSRRSFEDFYLPVFAHLSEQAVLNQEIYWNATDPLGVFGYQERWAEYRYGVSKVTGSMNSAAAAPLDVWHLAQYYTTEPVLNGSFIEDKPPIERIVEVPSEPQFKADIYSQCVFTRPMPMYSVPGMIDHF